MQTITSYQEREPRIDGYASIIREEQETYSTYLEKKVAEYMAGLDRLERRCSAPGADHEQLLSEITLLNDGILKECSEFEARVRDRDVILAAQARFRAGTEPLLRKSNFITHARTWPYGHQGDYQILEYAYRNTPISGGIGLVLDRYCLQTTLCVAVRDRKTMLLDLLREELARRRSPRIFDLACGSCRDVFELAPGIIDSNAQVTCVDFDPKALAFSADRLALSGIPDDRVEFRQYNAFRMVNHDRNLKEFGPQDVIYSVGFFDYIKDDVLQRLLGALFQLLNDGGRLIMSFKDARRYSSAFYHWMVDWNGFSRRTEEDCWTLIRNAGIPAESVEFRRDRSGVVMFFSATR